MTFAGYEAARDEIVRLLASPPPDGHKFWTHKLLAKESGIGLITVMKIMARAGLSTGAPSGGCSPDARHRAALAASARHEAGRAAISRLLASPPPDGRKFWTQKLLSRESGIGVISVMKIMAKYGLSTGPDVCHRPKLAASSRHAAGLAAISALLASPPPDEREFWTQELLARETGIGCGTVRNIMAEAGLSTGASRGCSPAVRARREAGLAAISGLLASPPPDGRKFWTQELLARETGIGLSRVSSIMAEAGLSTAASRGGRFGPGASASRRAWLTAISALLASPPPDGRKFWTQEFLARETGIRVWTVKRIMAEEGLTTGAPRCRQSVGHESKLSAISALLASLPPDGHGCWTQKLLSRESGISYYLVRKLMIRAGLSTGTTRGRPRRTVSSPPEAGAAASNSTDAESSETVIRDT
jgi:hypothetical protein